MYCHLPFCCLELANLKTKLQKEKDFLFANGQIWPPRCCGVKRGKSERVEVGGKYGVTSQPHSQGLSCSRPLSRSRGREEERPWERGWLRHKILLHTTSEGFSAHGYGRYKVT